MIRDIDRRVARAMAGVRQAFRGVLRRVNTAPAVALVQADGLATEQIQDAELMQHYGFTSAPPAGTMVVVVPVGGKTAHGIVIATEHGSYRMRSLPDGEVAIYDDLGQKVHLTRAGIVVEGAGRPVTVRDTPRIYMDAPLVEMTGKLLVHDTITGHGGLAIDGTPAGGGQTATITGDLRTIGTIVNNDHQIGSVHTHGGVQTGSGNTAAVN